MMLRLALASLLALIALPAFADGSRQKEAEIIIPNEKWREFAYEKWHYAPAVKVGNRLYASGIIAFEIDGDRKAGFAQAWEEIDETIKAAGGTGLDDIVEFTTYHVGIVEQLQDFAEVKDKYIKAPYPAWTAIGTPSLALPEGLVEIKYTALISD